MEETDTRSAELAGKSDDSRNQFDWLSDDLIIDILGRLSSAAESSSEVIGLVTTCKRFGLLAMEESVLKKASSKSIWIGPANWCESAHHFLTRCANAGNIEACYYLGMIEFYCLGRYEIGASLIEKATHALHPQALYSLAIIKFNGSGSGMGGPHMDDTLHAINLCRRASSLDQADSFRELVHCVRNNLVLSTCSKEADWLHAKANKIERHGRKVHPANTFLTKWWSSKDGDDIFAGELLNGLKMCAGFLCGRRETRSQEFSRIACSVCRKKCNCSFTCLYNDWGTNHFRMECNFKIL